jgi:hypothetical protein
MVGELIMLPVRIGVRATRLWLRAAEETVSIAASATSRVVGMTSRGSEQAAEPRPPESGQNGRSDLAGPSGAPSETSSAARESTTRGAASPRPSNGASAAAPTADRPPTPPAPPSLPPAPTDPPDALRDMMGEGEPAHVSEEPTLVEEFAEPGAEDGAGAQVHVQEPWAGYAKMNAKQIVGRVGSATPAELVAVQLYEGAHRGRQTVLNAVQRELRNPHGRSSGSQQRG